MNDKNKHVAIAYDENGKCLLVSKVKLVNDLELNKLFNEQHERESKELKEKQKIEDTFEKLWSCTSDINKRNIFIAKATYDRFVDRGFIDEDKEFDKTFFDFVFNGCELDYEKMPNEFKTIFEKVVG